MTNTTKLETMKHLLLAPWVSARSYCVDSVHSRSFISNEKTHEFLLLKGLSSDIWKRITDGNSLEKLETYATSEGASKELYPFLCELRDAQLITIKDNEISNSHASKFNNENHSGSIEIEMMQWAKEKGNLWSIHWEMTYLCNEKCIHCLNPVSRTTKKSAKKNSYEGELTTKEAFSLIDEMLSIGVFQLVLSGGEATLRKDFLDIMRYARQVGMCVNIVTNAIGWSDEFIDEVSKLWPHSVVVSIYSSNPQLHDQITQVNNSFERSVSVVKKLNEKGIKTSLNSVQTQHTIQGHELTKDLGISLKADISVDLSIFPKLNGEPSPLSLQVDNYGELVALAAKQDSPIYSGDYKKMTSHGSRLEKDKSVCNAGQFSLTINPTGEVSPCLLLPMMVGSVREIGLRTIWQDGLKANTVKEEQLENKAVGYLNDSNLLGKWLDVKVKDLRECGTHEYCELCAVCPGKSLLETGDLLGASPSNCRLACARFEAAALLEKGMSYEEICAKFNVSRDFGRIYEQRGKVSEIVETKKYSSPSKQAKLAILDKCRTDFT